MYSFDNINAVGMCLTEKPTTLNPARWAFFVGINMQRAVSVDYQFLEMKM